jgi:hypothetical protein
VKKTLNIREGDFEAIGQITKMKPSIAIRKILSAFVDKHAVPSEVPDVPETFDL